MKKILFSALLALATVSPVFADATSDRIDELQAQITELQTQLDDLKAEIAGSEEKNEESIPNDTDYTYDNKGITCTYYGSGSTIFNDKKFVVLYFDFENNTGSSIRPSSLPIQAFQDGIEIKGFSLIGSDIPEIDNNNKEILNGASIKIARAYETNSNADITVHIHPSFFWHEYEMLEFTIPLE